MTSRPKKASRREQDDGDDGADAGDQRRADGPADQPAGARAAALRVGGVADDLGDAEHRRRSAHSQPMTSRPRASGRGPRRSSRRAAKNSTTGSTMTSEPMIQRTAVGQAGADRADAVAPRRGAQHDRQAEDGQADAVAAVLGRERLGLLRPGDRPGEAAGAAGEQVPAAAGDDPTGRSELFFGGGTAVAAERLAAGRFLLAAVEPERPREDAGRRVDVVRAGMRRTVIAVERPDPGRRTVVSRTGVRGS